MGMGKNKLMHILVFNVGSSTLKSALFHIETAHVQTTQPQKPIWQGLLDWGREKSTYHVHTLHGAEQQGSLNEKTLSQAANLLLSTIWQGETKVIKGPSEIDAVAHRVVHGGDQFFTPTKITPKVKRAIEALNPLAPLHNPNHLRGMGWIEAILPTVPQVAVFDTGFHRSIPEEAKTYPIPYTLSQKGIHKYGFHGISHDYCSKRVATLLGQERQNLRIITCHLGNGASLTAISHGKCADTTMGFTPLDGLMMGTRSGSIDPGIVLHLMKSDYTVNEIDECLNRKSGLLGICGAADMRTVLEKRKKGDPKAELAYKMYTYRIKFFIGALTASLNGIDTLVFTAGVGEHSPEIRKTVCNGLSHLGVAIDEKANTSCVPDQEISAHSASIRTFVIKTQEEWEIATQAAIVL